ncbi:Bug family tripartite tricarboxylate transporter substrate binding protein [Brachymonas denitrificans]|jgi:tripartite-type tricarboxylate transporter receptor subunit TctC|uniref:Tripartite-type tricarboxylate transporter, receptor component TctC n=1 Tax=Brachymonas denitrificans DSM 15123 TaxID=1121117 RepID=A0A1H8DNH8_9BURK|nr:tripartite tricarboxylate transporter substrate binding protein [Brachymonas denitrificans]SEN08118.1 Tripartite-type tricarboxylate transporter, receptor component TctC [Brachymonas denitrificans DSM 15123]
MPCDSRRRTLALACSALAAATLLPLSAQAANAWPSRPVRLVVGFPGGSSPDLTARLLAEPLAKALGKPVVVENRPGAGGNVGAAAVVNANDDHTFGLMINGNLTIARILNPRAPYDPLKDLQPVSLIGTAPLLLAAPASTTATTPAAFLQQARAGGDKWNYGSPGVGTIGHLGMELLKSQTGIRALHVPYPGYAQVAQAMLAGDLHMSMLPPALALAQVKAGKLKAIGVTSRGRSSLAPGVPPLGLPNFELEIWNAVATSKKTSPQAVQTFARALADVMRQPAIREKLMQQGWQPVGSSAEGLASRIQGETRALGDIIRRNNIRPQ